MDKDGAIKKLQKLVALQTGAEKVGSKGEAYQAARAIKKLLTDHNLTMKEVEGADLLKESIKQGELFSGTMRDSRFRFRLLGTIAVNNLCRVYRRGDKKFFVVGREENVTVVEHFYKYLLKVCDILANDYVSTLLDNECVKLTIWSAADRKCRERFMAKALRSYKYGFVVGLEENYESLKPSSRETALVVCHEKAISDFISSNFHMAAKRTRTRRVCVVGDCYEQGRGDGQKVSLARQIERT